VLLRRHRRHEIAISVILVPLLLAGSARAGKSPYDWALIRLDYAREEKLEELRRFCDRIHALARKAARDEMVIGLFEILRQKSQVQEDLPPAINQQVEAITAKFQRYYLENYLAFYDILFIDPAGSVVHTIRNRHILGRHVSEIEHGPNTLWQCLRERPTEERFVDFHFYEPSSEPAAFFVEPVFKDGTLIGWIALQCAINKANNILAWTQDLGLTGETFLVNRDGFMLTESSFEGSSTILKKKLDDRNIQAKFAQRNGHRTVIDYRGQEALSSFEAVEFLGTEWLVVAKIDKSEVVTDHFARNRRYYADRLVDYLNKHPVGPLQEADPTPPGTTLRVDMDEFLRAADGERLHTFGVSTCTALLVSHPGKFAYLAHISPKDRIYGQHETNLLGRMIRRVETFDVYPYERQQVLFTFVAPHYEGLLPAIDLLVEEGFLLSQVRVLCNPDARCATVDYGYAEDELLVRWSLRHAVSAREGSHSTRDTCNIGSIIQEFIEQEEEIHHATGGHHVASGEACPARVSGGTGGSGWHTNR
jgi:hypothetical protein